MSNVSDMLVLLALGATVGAWMKLSAARERAVREARTQCQQHGLQLLDETVGLRRIRLRRVQGMRRVERCYDFEVSIDGSDRQPGRLWMIGNVLSSLSLPVIERLQPTELNKPALNVVDSNVVALVSRLRRPPNRLQ